MIEIEKRFEYDEKVLERLLADSEFLGEKMNHDIYYDYDDLRLLYGGIKFRNRNGNFELKIKQNEIGAEIEVEKEVEDEEEIKKYFNTEKDLREFVKELQVFSDIENMRKKYRHGDFIIDLDNLSFGYKLVEIELLIEDGKDAAVAQQKIRDFAAEYGLAMKDVPSKRQKYLEKFRPDLYEKLYGKK